MPSLRTIAAGALLALAAPDDALADRLVAPASPSFKSVAQETGNAFGHELIAYSGYVYFAANDNIHGNELWRTNGAETTLVADLYPGVAANSGDPHDFTVAGSRLFFDARPGPDQSSETVHYIDASAPTTVKVAKAAPVGGGPAVTAAATLVGAVNDKAIVSRLQGETMNSNYAVYALGDTGDTFVKISTGSDDINANNVFTASATAGGWLYYSRSNTNASPGVGPELWRTDGSSTELAADIYPNSPPTSYPGSGPGGFVATSDRVYFTADDGTHGRELWVTNPADKADTHIVHEHHDNATGTSIEEPGAVANGNILYYTPNDPTTGGEVWRTDGTEAGTRVVKDLTPGPDAFAGPDPFPFKTGIGMLRGSDIYVSDGTDAGTIKVGEGAGDGIGPNTPVVRGGQAYFVAGYSPYGQALWRTDGTPGGTSALTAGGFDTAANGCTCAQSLAVLGDKIIFFSRAPGTSSAGDVKVFYLDTTQADDTRANTAAPTISGPPAVGSTLTGDKGAWTREPNTYVYAWLRNGTPVPNATSTTYTPSAVDAGARITFSVQASGIGAPNLVTADSAPVTIGGAAATATPFPSASPSPGPSVSATLTVNKKPRLKGKARVGAKLRITLPKLGQTGVKVKVAWTRNGKRIKGQTKASLKLRKADKGKRISATITITKAGFKTLKLKVGPTAKVK